MSVSVDLSSESTSAIEKSGDETSELVSDSSSSDSEARRHQASDASCARDDRIPWFDWKRDKQVALVLLGVVVVGLVWAVAVPSINSEDDVACIGPATSLDARCMQQDCSSWCPTPWDEDSGPCFDLRFGGPLAAYDRLVQKLREYYAFTEWRGIDWDELAEAFRPMAPPGQTVASGYSMSSGEFQEAVNRLLASVPDSHVEIGGPALSSADDLDSFNGICGQGALEEFRQRRHAAIGGGFGHTIAALDDGTVIVTHVVAGSAAGLAGVKVADVVSSLDGTPIDEAVHNLGLDGWIYAELNPATAEHRLAHQYRTAVRASIGTERQWRFAERDVTLVAEADDMNTWNLTKPMMPNEPDGKIHHRELSSSIGYIGFSNEEFDDIVPLFVQALTALSDTRGLIVDLRGNTGGSDNQGAEVNGFFMHPNASSILYEHVSYSNRYFTQIGKTAQGAADEYSMNSEETQMQEPIAPSYTKPVVCLINEFCYSTCEGIADGFAKLPRVRSQVVGFRGTSGSFGMSGGTVLLPGNFNIGFPFGRSLNVDGVIQIESNEKLVGGVLPTTKIPMNSTNAIGLIRSKISGNPDFELDYARVVLEQMINSP